MPHAKFQLGVLFERGDGVPQNETIAAGYYIEAAEQGLDWAQYFLAQLHRRGAGVPFDQTLAYAWLNIAASAGNNTAANERNQLRAKLTKDDISKAQDISLKLLKVSPEAALANRQRFLPPGQRKAGATQTGSMQPSDRTRDLIGGENGGKKNGGSNKQSNQNPRPNRSQNPR